MQSSPKPCPLAKGSLRTSLIEETLVATTSDEESTRSARPSSGTAHHGDGLGGLRRDLSNRKVQLVAVGGSIGTALLLSIGGDLNKAGPGGLLLAFAICNVFLALVNNCMAEMTVYMPVSGNFIRMAGHWVDDALGFCAGWNLFLYQFMMIPFEITALSLVLSYWSDHIPVAAIFGGCMVLYFFLNVSTVAVYGEAEFWLSSGKVLLLTMLLCFTFVTMVGGNPQHDAYGFRYWNTPGAFAECSSTGTVGRFEGFLAAVWSASFTCVGPEYVGMMAAEAKHPRTYVKTAFEIVYVRLVVFLVGGALAVGVLVPFNDPVLESVYGSGSGGTGPSQRAAAASPYIIAMQNMGVQVFPHIVTALMATTIFSAGNTYVFCATRSLYSMALEGRAPRRLLTKCTRRGIPVYAFLVVMLAPLLSLLQLSSSSAQVLAWLINVATGATIINYIVTCITYVCFHRACTAQGFDRSALPYYARFQPWSAWIPLVADAVILLCSGYKSVKPFDSAGFLTAYAMPIMVPLLFVGWKLAKRTTWRRPRDVDLVWEAPSITAYEMALDDRPVGFFEDCYLALRSVVQRDEGDKSNV
ncbi:Amino acid/polyamine transporter I [Niveomyces insectorum RCEF 264]|uniref:Amino acid/polyamine transporter I n=1 Tax=Niveomyces insectorum RCEF 264 TaxID=1081102 RepID=A0A167UW71_9HYPO|nr:Amino acid/polyamine transporter I [Niveomyces insectorum RCEF 264]